MWGIITYNISIYADKQSTEVLKLIQLTFRAYHQSYLYFLQHEMKEVLKRTVSNIQSQGGRVGELENWGTKKLPYKMVKNNEKHTEGL